MQGHYTLHIKFWFTAKLRFIDFCRGSIVCALGTNAGATFGCRANHTGYFCAACTPGHVNINGVCARCDSTSWVNVLGPPVSGSRLIMSKRQPFPLAYWFTICRVSYSILMQQHDAMANMMMIMIMPWQIYCCYHRRGTLALAGGANGLSATTTRQWQ